MIDGIVYINDLSYGVDLKLFTYENGTRTKVLEEKLRIPEFNKTYTPNFARLKMEHRHKHIIEEKMKLLNEITKKINETFITSNYFFTDTIKIDRLFFCLNESSMYKNNILSN